MRVIQLLPTISYGDAVGNDTLALDQILKKNGFNSYIYAENIDHRLENNLVKYEQKMPKLNKNDILIYHLSTGSELNYKIKNYDCKKMIIYHNITPSEYLEPYNKYTSNLCYEGRNAVKYLSNKVDYCLADSKYNKEELDANGYKKTDVLPILINFNDYKRSPSQKILRLYEEDGYINILFTGRIAPNKKQEDVIAAFYFYNKYINPKSRLFLVGSYNGMETYYHRLQKYVERLQVQNVIFTGHIPFDEILAYYHLADIFLCMSEHEGFCVPLVEAMYFNIPIIAYDSSAIAETMGGSGIVIDRKEPILVAKIIDRILNDKNLYNAIIQGEKERLKDFDNEKIERNFLKYLNQFLEK